MGAATTLRGPDFSVAVPISGLPEGAPVMGHFQGEPVVMVRRGDEVFAIGGACSHYGASLGDGVVAGKTRVARGIMPVSLFEVVRLWRRRRSTPWPTTRSCARQTGCG